MAEAVRNSFPSLQHSRPAGGGIPKNNYMHMRRTGRKRPKPGNFSSRYLNASAVPRHKKDVNFFRQILNSLGIHEFAASSSINLSPSDVMWYR